MKPYDFKGKTFGKLAVLDRAGSDDRGHSLFNSGRFVKGHKGGGRPRKGTKP